MCDQKCVMVTGASGLLGRAISANLATLGDDWRVIGIAKSRCADNLLHLDLLNAEQVRETIARLKPDVIIHSAAERSCEKVDADYKTGFHFNVTISGVISAAAAEYGGLVVYISTDYVFDGNNPPYSETHATSPINSYGKTKYEGEIATIESNSRSLVLRVPVLYGPVEYIKESAVTCLLEVLTKKKDGLVPVSNYEIRYPTHVNDVAKCCTQLVQKALQNNDVRGVYHFSGREPLTKFEMVKVMSEVFGLGMDHVVADNNPTVGPPRPKNSQLDTKKLEGVLGKEQLCHTKFETGIKQSLEPYVLSIK